jgi:hypothetical protein
MLSIILSKLETYQSKRHREDAVEAPWSLLDEFFAPCDREASLIPDLTTENSFGIY